MKITAHPKSLAIILTMAAAGLEFGCSSKSSTECINENSSDPACVRARAEAGIPDPDPTTDTDPVAGPPVFSSGLEFTGAAGNKVIGWSERASAEAFVSAAVFTENPTVSYKVIASDGVCDATVADFAEAVPTPADITADGRYKVCAKAVNSAGEAFQATSTSINRWVDSIYVGGNFEATLGADAVEAKYLARWDGNLQKWFPVADGPDKGVQDLDRGAEGVLLAVTENPIVVFAPEATSSAKLFRFDGKNWVHKEIPGTPVSMAVNSSRVAIAYREGTQCDVGTTGSKGDGLCLYDPATDTLTSAATTMDESLVFAYALQDSDSNSATACLNGPNFLDAELTTMFHGLFHVISYGEDFIFTGGNFDFTNVCPQARNIGFTRDNKGHSAMSTDSYETPITAVHVKDESIYFATEQLYTLTAPVQAGIRKCDINTTTLQYSNCQYILNADLIMDSAGASSSYTVQKIFDDGTDVYALGNMSYELPVFTAMNPAIYGILKWNGTTWSTVDASGLAAGSVVRDAGVHPNGKIYMTYSIPGVAPQAAALYELNGTSWTKVGDEDFETNDIRSIEYPPKD
jgi:hypothetical protein